jgi:hypothetical protein
MPTILIPKFKDGLDARRLPETTNSGALIKAVDGHITRGGEFEKRFAFVPTYTLPAGQTVSLAATADSLYVFGDLPAPTMPTGVLYRQLNFSSITLERVVSWDLFNNEIYAVGQFLAVAATQHFYGTTLVPSRIGTGASDLLFLSGGAPGDTVNVIVDGVSVTGGPVVYVVDLAAEIAAAINSTVTSPEYLAIGLGLAVLVATEVRGTEGNGRTVTVVTTGAVIVTPAFGVLQGGQEAFLQGTRYVRTIGTKEYTLSESDLQFSSVGDPLDWDGATSGVGYGFIDTSSYTSGSEDLTAVVEFNDGAAVFSQRTVQIWHLEADPDNNVLRQRLRNTGTSCPKSITQYGDNDIFYLDENGLKSLRAANSSSAASTYGVGVKADPLIVAKLRSLTEDERSLVVGLIEPGAGNFWLIVKDTIYVYAFFEEEGVSAWTTYLPGFDVDDAVVFNRRVYLRSGDTIYVYGGLETGEETDATVAEMWTAYQDGDDPANAKTWAGFDAAVSGEWSVAVGASLRDTDEEDDVCIISRTTYNDERIGLVGQSTHASLRFRSRGAGPATVGACALHYE